MPLELVLVECNALLRAPPPEGTSCCLSACLPASLSAFALAPLRCCAIVGCLRLCAVALRPLRCSIVLCLWLLSSLPSAFVVFVCGVSLVVVFSVFALCGSQVWCGGRRWVAAARCLALPHSLLYEGLVLPCPGAGTSVSRGWYFLSAPFWCSSAFGCPSAFGCLLCLWLSPLRLVVFLAFGCLFCLWLSSLPFVVFCLWLPLRSRLCALGGCLCLCAFALWRVPFAFAPCRVCVCVLGRLPLRLWLLPLPLRLCAFALWWVVSAFAPLRVLLLCRWAVACAFALRWCAFACCVFSCLPWFAWGLSLQLAAEGHWRCQNLVFGPAGLIEFRCGG